jgi:hypothetical protein
MRRERPKGLEPDRMIVELLHVHVGIPPYTIPKPQIDSSFLHKRLNFQLELFEDWCKNFRFCMTNHDMSRAEVIIALFIGFFRERQQIFTSHSVDLDFFFQIFNKAQLYGDFRNVVQLDQNCLYDPMIYLIGLMGKCDARFLAYFAERDFALAVLSSIVHSETSELRVFRNATHLLLQLFQFQHLVADPFVEFFELYERAFEKLDEMKMPSFLKSEILFSVVFQSDALPDYYIPFGMILIDPANLTDQSLLYAASSLAVMINKSPEFATTLYDIGVIDDVLNLYQKSHPVPARYGILSLYLAMFKARDEEFRQAMLGQFDFADISAGVTSLDTSVATIAFQFAAFLLPGSLPRLLGAFPRYFQLLDAVIASMMKKEPELVVAGLKFLQLLGQFTPKQLLQFSTNDFLSALLGLLRSGIVPFQDESLSFFDAFLNTGDVPLNQLSNWCVEFEDAGAAKALLQLARTGDPAVRPHAEAVRNRIESIERAHRNRRPAP